MNRHLTTVCISCTLALGACSSNKPAPVAAPQASANVIAPAAVAPQQAAPMTIEDYKKTVAQRIVGASPDIFTDPLPDMLKSIVVLDITIDREGRLEQVSVRRSNGFKALENRALESVKRAAPFVAPASALRGRDGSVRYLESFLFRNDGRFRIRSLEPA